MPRKSDSRITINAVKTLEPGQQIADSEVRGFRARRLPSGAVSFGLQYWNADERRLRWLSLGVLGEVTVEEARRKAKIEAGKLAGGDDPAADRDRGEADSVNALLDNFLKRYVEANALRSAKEIRRTFDVYVRPRLGARSIYKLGRNDIVKLLDDIADDNGPVQCDRVLAFLRKAFNWQMTRDERFTSPIIKGMARSKPGDRARKRILDDGEIRDLFGVLEQGLEGVPAYFPAMVRALLLTGQRCGNVSQMHSDEIDRRDWVIDVAARTKLSASTNNEDAFIVPLSAPMQRLVDGRKGWIFSPTGEEQPRVNGFSKEKGIIDRALEARRKVDGRKPMAHWTWHDLRRTARSIMSRYSTPDIAERAVGHKIPGVRGIYDRYEYLDEKRGALEALARHVETIIRPRGGAAKVVAFPSRGRGGARSTGRPARGVRG